MRLLLTSTGITNETIAAALRKLAGKRIRIAFIPTAMHGSTSDDKSWLIKNYNECERLGPTNIVDIAAVSKKVWLPQLKAATIIVMGGGKPSYLAKAVKESGLTKEIPKLLEKRVYVGISAGSIVTQKTIFTASDFLFSNKKAPKGLGLIGFGIVPHLNSPKFSKFRDVYLKEALKKSKSVVYALDDDSAVMYVDGRIKVVSEGKWKRYQEL